MNLIRPTPHFLLPLGALALSACGSSSSDNVRFFPQDLAIASPTQTGQSATSFSRLLASRSSARASVYGEDYATLVSTLARMLISPSSDSDCAFNLTLAPTFADAACYGPQLTYANHPEGAGGSGTLPSGDVGLWEETEATTGEACAAAQLNTRMNGIAKLANGGVFLTASLYCSAQVHGVALPNMTGASVDLTSTFNGTIDVGTSSATVSSATLTCSADNGSRCTEYLSLVEATVSGKTIELRMKHRPTNTTGTLYRGKLSYTVQDPSATEFNCQGTADANTGVTYAVSIGYEKSSSASLKYKLDSGSFCGLGEDPYISVTNFTVDASKKAMQGGVSDATGWSGNFTKVTSDFDPDTGEGDYSLTWEAGPNDGYSRSMLARIEQLAATNAGVAYFGYGPEVDQTGAGEIDGMICNWAGPGADHSQISATTYAQKQIFAGGPDTLYSAYTSNIKYAPLNSCNKADSSSTFTQTGGGGTADIGAADTFTHELVAVSDVSVAVPTEPTDVD